jgi:DnaJ-class molecular chaperone
MGAEPRFARDYYATLGVTREAVEDEIRKAYRRLALRWHPDRNPEDPTAEERFKEVSEAYAVLIDPAKRREYDRLRWSGTAGDFRHTREDVFRDLFADPRASGVFEELAREFGRMGMRVDRHHFRQTLFGGRAVVTGGVFIITPLTPVWMLLRLASAALRGAGRTVAGAAAPSLPGGRGLLGLLAWAGRRLVVQAPSAADVIIPLSLTRAEARRGGRKRVRLNRAGRPDDLMVTIPAGLHAGAKLRLRGKGRPARDGSCGDLYLAVEISD